MKKHTALLTLLVSIAAFSLMGCSSSSSSGLTAEKLNGNMEALESNLSSVIVASAKENIIKATKVETTSVINTDTNCIYTGPYNYLATSYVAKDTYNMTSYDNYAASISMTFDVKHNLQNGLTLINKGSENDLAWLASYTPSSVTSTDNYVIYGSSVRSQSGVTTPAEYTETPFQADTLVNAQYYFKKDFFDTFSGTFKDGLSGTAYLSDSKYVIYFKTFNITSTSNPLYPSDDTKALKCYNEMLYLTELEKKDDGFYPVKKTKVRNVYYERSFTDEKASETALITQTTKEETTLSYESNGDYTLPATPTFDSSEDQMNLSGLAADGSGATFSSSMTNITNQYKTINPSCTAVKVFFTNKNLEASNYYGFTQNWGGDPVDGYSKITSSVLNTIGEVKTNAAYFTAVKGNYDIYAFKDASGNYTYSVLFTSSY